MAYVRIKALDHRSFLALTQDYISNTEVQVTEAHRAVARDMGEEDTAEEDMVTEE